MAAPGLADGVDFAIERLFDVQAFDHGFDDPIAVGDVGEVVLEIAGRHELGRARRHERSGFRFQHLLDGAGGERIAVGRALRDDVEQPNRHPGIGELRGDTGAHDAGADHGDLTDRFHGTALP